MNADFKQDGNLTVGDKVYKDKVLEVQVSLNINPEPVNKHIKDILSINRILCLILEL